MRTLKATQGSVLLNVGQRLLCLPLQNFQIYMPRVHGGDISTLFETLNFYSCITYLKQSLKRFSKLIKNAFLSTYYTGFIPRSDFPSLTPTNSRKCVHRSHPLQNSHITKKSIVQESKVFIYHGNA